MSAPRGRVRLGARLSSAPAQVAMVLALLPWLIAPGVIQPDTKIDLVISPWRYLGRALDAWSTHSGFGELQNQAYGYLFPMGPFFGLLHTLGIPGWAAQRAWWSFLLVVGFLGAVSYARRAVGLSTAAAVVVGLAYALSPRVLTLLSELSVETWPGMVMPWMLLALHRLRTRSGRRATLRAVAVVGLLTAALGGVNATASLVPVLATLVYALVVVRPRRRAGAVLLGVVLGSAWWLGPLVVLGGYAYPFMDFIETSRITTAVTTLPGILRGASDWVAYIIDADGHPVWQSGWVVAQGFVSIVATTALAGAGLAGLAARASQGGVRDRDTAEPEETDEVGDAHGPDSRALVVLLALGTLGMAAGYAGAAHGPQAGFVRTLLDGPLAAARNVHKLDPLVRLPLAVGVGCAVSALAARGGRASSASRRLGAAGIALLLVGSMSPLLSGRLADAAGVSRWPSALSETAREIDARAARQGGSTLVLPSARTADFTWGTTGDEPLSAFAASPIAVRASAPLYHPGAQRLVDRIDLAVASSRDVGAALRAASRAGVRRVVIRWGLSPAQRAGSAQSDVAALERSGATRNHRRFGAGAARYDVFDLAEAEPPTNGVPIGVLGGPESTVTLAAVGVGASRPLLTGRAGGWITDDVRLREYANGRPASLAYGPTLPVGDPEPSRLGARDLDFDGRSASLTTLRLSGASSVTAQRSTSDPFSDVYLGPGTSPASAFDASPRTRWLTPAREPSPLVIGWAAGAPAQHLTVTGSATGGSRVSGVAAVADGRRLPVTSSGGAWGVDVPAGTHSLALVPVGVARAGDAAAAIGFASVISTRPIEATALLPGAVDPNQSGVVMSRAGAWADGRPLASEDDGTMTRSIRLASPGTMTLQLRLNGGPVAGPAAAVWMRPAGGRWRRVTPTASPARDGRAAPTRVALPAGLVEFKASPEVERIVLLPESPSALSALGVGTPAASSGVHVTTSTTQGANPGWRTRTGRGAMVTLDGWRQGVLGGRDGDGLRFAPQSAHVASLAVGVGCLVVLVALGALSARRSPGSPTGSPMALPSRSAPRWHPRVGVVIVAAMGVAVVGLWALPLMTAALLVPPRARRAAVLATLACVGPVMACLGVVDRGSIGTLLGQLLTAFALALFSLDVLQVPPLHALAGARAARPPAN